MPGHSSQASVALTSESSGPVEPSSCSAKPTRGGGKSSRPDSPASPASRTWRLFVSNQRRELREMDVSPSLTEPGGFTQSPFLISSSEDSPARMSQSPASDAASPESAPGSSSTPADSSRLFDPEPFSSRTFQVSSLAKAVGTSESCLPRWPTSGTAWLGGFSTAVSSECRSADGVCSSVELTLQAVLEPSSPEKYWLSARAARGILRRAQKRGRTIHPTLLRALSAVAGDTPETTLTGGGGGHTSLSGLGNGGPDDNDAQAGRLVVAAPLTSGGHSDGVSAPGRRKEDDVNIVAFHSTGGGAKALAENEDVSPGTGTGRAGQVAVALTAKGDQGDQENYVVEGQIVRRLMPVECERLQGFPDDWTDLGDTADTPRYSAVGDAVTVNVSHWLGVRL